MGKQAECSALSALHLAYQALVACKAACRTHSREFLVNDFR